MPLTTLFRLLFWAALVFAFAMAVHPRPPTLPGDPSDKVQHIVAFLTLAVLAVRAYPTVPLVAIGVGLSAVGALIEIVQLIPFLYRDGSVLDWLADTAAVVLVLAVVAFLRRRRRFHDSEKLC